MRITILCGAPCSGKTTLAHHIALPTDWVVDYDDLARNLGSPVLWQHPEPWRTRAEQALQARLAAVDAHPGTGTAWVLRTAPRAHQRARLATQWQADVYLLDPGERVCARRAVVAERPSGTRRAISEWYHRCTPWVADRDPGALATQWASIRPRLIAVDPHTV